MLRWWRRLFGRINKNYKDRLFIKIFSDKEALLSLYNAVNGTDYTNTDDIQINTIDDYLYMGMKNDVSFLFTNVLNLYEHQSTFNPNMPLRGLLYFSSLYQKMYDGEQLFGSKLLSIPVPQMVVFYNGTREEPDRVELKLSDAFIGNSAFEPCLECRAIMLNINKGHNEQLMRACRKLDEYSTFVAMVRDNLKAGMKLRDAVDKAVDDCIANDILKDLLLSNRKEVTNMLLTEFNQKKFIKYEKNISYDEGKIDGIAEGRTDVNSLNAWLKETGRVDDLLRATEDYEYQQKLFDEFLSGRK